VGQVDNADLADDHLHVGEVIPSHIGLSTLKSLQSIHV
jgi:hypothetical protein